VSSILTTVVVVVAAAVAAVLVVELSHWLLGRLGRRSPLAADLARTAHRPFQVTLQKK